MPKRRERLSEVNQAVIARIEKNPYVLTGDLEKIDKDCSYLYAECVWITIHNNNAQFAEARLSGCIAV